MPNLTDHEVDRIIHTHRKDKDGKPLCWHGWDAVDSESIKKHKDTLSMRKGCVQVKCVHCEIITTAQYYWNKKPRVETYQPHENNFIPPSYTSNGSDYLEAVGEFMRKDWWEDFIDQVEGREFNREYPMATLLNPLRGSHAIAEYGIANLGWKVD